MKTRIKIAVPHGQARGMEKKLRPYILGKNNPHSVYINDSESELIWEVESDVKAILKINRNVALFDSIIQQAFSSKMVKRIVKKKLSIEDQKELEDMLFNHTRVEVIQEATAQEIVESNKTWWQKMKEKFKKIDN